MNDTIKGVSTWRMAGGGPQRQGLSAQTVSFTPQLEQRLECSGSATSECVFSAEGIVFAADRAGGVQAFQPNGDLIWRRMLAGGIDAAPALDQNGERLFVATQLGRVHALDASNGKTIWETYIPARRDPRILSDLLYLDKADSVVASSWSETYFILDGASGDLKHSGSAGMYPRVPFSTDSDETLFGIRTEWKKDGCSVICFKSSLNGDDELVFGHDMLAVTNQFSPPIIIDDQPIILTNEDERSSICLEPQTMISQNTCVNAPLSVSPDGKLIVMEMNGQGCEIKRDQSDIRSIRFTQVDYWLGGAAVDAEGTRFAGDPHGVLHRWSEEEEPKILHESGRAFETRPSISPDGRLFAPCADGFVYVFA